MGDWVAVEIPLPPNREIIKKSGQHVVNVHSDSPIPQNSSEMSQRPAEVPLPPTPDSERPPLPETHSVTSDAVSIAASTGTTQPENPKKNPEGDRKHRTWRWISNPQLIVLIILIVVTGTSFWPALLSESKFFDVVSSVGDEIHDPDADGVRSSDVTDQGGSSD